ncbi:MAG: hypothetical protein RLZZ592_2550 [Pseudomonadota bacterium]|jgi:hypothetical protein
MNTTLSAQGDHAPDFRPTRRHWLGTTFGLGLLGLGGGLLGGCGGGVGSNGTGSPAILSQGVGTVSGFGSVVVDGVRRDDSAASVGRTRADGGRDSAEARLGQRVVLTYGSDASGAEVLEQVEVRPSLAGIVTERTLDTLGVLGQTVRLNADPALGPVTVLGEDWTSLSAIALGQDVEVHAIVLGAPGQARHLLATRIDRRTSAAETASVRLVAPVAEAGAVAADGRQTVRIGALAVRLPAGERAEPGQLLTVHAAATDFDVIDLTLQAVRIEVDPGSTAAAAGSRLERTGLIAGWSGTTFTVDGTLFTVDAATARVPDTLALADGRWVRVMAQRSSDGQRWQATSVAALSGSGNALLLGTLSDWAAATGSLRVRDTRVVLNASTALDLSATASAALTEGLYVEVTGSIGVRGIVAERVRSLSEPAGTSAQITRQGPVTAFDLAAGALVLQHTQGDGRVRAITVAWDARTHWRDPLQPAAAVLAALVAAGSAIEVEGALSADGSRLQARQVRLRSSSGAASSPGDERAGSASRLAQAGPSSRSSSDTLQRCQSAS